MTPEEKIEMLLRCVGDLHNRVKIIEERHNDRVDAMNAADEAMEEADDLEHGPY